MNRVSGEKVQVVKERSRCRRVTCGKITNRVRRFDVCD